MEYLLKASFLIASFYLMYRLFLYRDTLFLSHRWFLLSGIILSCLLPLVIIPNYVEKIVNPISSELPQQDFMIEPTIAVINETVDYSIYLSWLYFSIVIILLSRLLLQLFSFYRLISDLPAHRLNNIKYVETNSEISPFSFFNYIIYNPDLYNEEELYAILEHERIHVRHGHTYDVLLTEVLCSLFWFNPLSWLYKKALKQNLEYIADQFANQNQYGKINYSNLLVKTSIPNYKSVITNKFFNSIIKKRIVMLQKPKSNRLNSLKYLVALPVLGLFLMSFNTKTIYVDITVPNEVKKDTIEYWNVLKFTVNKNTSDNQIEDIKNKLEENKDVSINFTLKRNDQNKLEGINIVYKTKNSNGNYMISPAENFQPISIEYDVTGEKISIGANQSTNLSHTIQLEPKRAKIAQKNDTIRVVKNVKSNTLKTKLKVIDVDSIKNINTDTRIIVRNKDNVMVIADTIVLDENRSYNWVSSDGSNSNAFVVRNTNGLSYVNSDTDDALFIVNGKIVDKSKIKTIDANLIKGINVLKGENAIAIHGDKGKNGVVVITTRDNFNINRNDNDKAVVLNTFVFENEEDSNNDKVAGYIFKNTNEKELNENANMLKKNGIDVKYSRIRRNRSGEITQIKIFLKDKKGKNTTATYRNDDGIPKISYGKINDKLFIDSFD